MSGLHHINYHYRCRFDCYERGHFTVFVYGGPLPARWECEGCGRVYLYPVPGATMRRVVEVTP